MPLFRSTVLCLLASVLTLPTQAVRLPSAYQLPSSLGDSRFAGLVVLQSVTNLLFSATLPPGEWDEMTVTGWLRITGSMAATEVTTFMNYTPETVQYSNPDLAQDAFCHLSSTNISGTVTFDPFPWQPYEPGIASNTWPRGVYTIAGWASNAVTVSLGGADVTLGPGAFNHNVIPGDGSAVAVTGTGLVSIGISRTPASQFFSNGGQTRFESAVVNTIRCITNELVFCAWRLRLSPGVHIAETYMASCSGFLAGATETNAPPDHASCLSSRGIYQFGLFGPIRLESYDTFELFDGRVFSYRLSDSDLTRIWTNALPEIQRRAIPRWK